MAALVDIYNMAISHAGSRTVLANTSGTDQETKQCNIHYETVRHTVIKAASFPSTKTYAALAAAVTRVDGSVWNAADPAPSYKYAYTLPSGILAPRHLHSYDRFKLSTISGTVHLMSNREDAILHYVEDVTDTTKWDPDFVNAVAYALASRIVYSLSGKTTRADKLMDLANDYVAKARTDIANEQDEYFENVPSWISIRGYPHRATPVPYFWPYESLNVLVA